jgi:hypothetical protein
MSVKRTKRIEERQKVFGTSFAAAYVANNRNATRAYRSVKPKVKETTASTESIRLLGNPWVQSEIERITNEALKRQQVGVDQILAEWANLGFTDPAELLYRPGDLNYLGEPTVPGTVRALFDMRPEVRRAIKSMKFDENGRPQFTFWSKETFQGFLGKTNKLLGPDTQVTIQLGFAERLRAAREKRLKGDK